MPFPTTPLPPLLLLLSFLQNSYMLQPPPWQQQAVHRDNAQVRCKRARQKFAASLLPTLCILIERLPGLVLYRSAMKLKLLALPSWISSWASRSMRRPKADNVCSCVDSTRRDPTRPFPVKFMPARRCVREFQSSPPPLPPRAVTPGDLTSMTSKILFKDFQARGA